MSDSIRIGVIGCDVIKREIDKVVQNDPHVVHKEYLEYALHTEPDKLKFTVMDKVNQLEGKVDAVLLGYAVCQSLKGVTKELRVPTVMLEGDDCIATVLTPMGYEMEKRICTGTWFNTPGWAEVGIDGAIKELHLDSAIEQGYDAMYFMHMMFEGYSRVLFVDTGVGDRDHWEERSKDFAARLNLRHECRDCDLRLIEEAFEATKKLAQEVKAKMTGVASKTPMASNP